MTNSNSGFWPSDIDQADEVSPAALLRSAASELSSKTSGLLGGEVVTESAFRGSPARPSAVLRHKFFITAPTLDDYRYLLLTAEHGAVAYPTTVTLEPTGKEWTCESADDLLNILREALGDPVTLRIVKSLKAQVQT